MKYLLHVAFFAAILALACGGSGPTSPSSSWTPTTVTTTTSVRACALTQADCPNGPLYIDPNAPWVCKCDVCLPPGVWNPVLLTCAAPGPGQPTTTTVVTGPPTTTVPGSPTTTTTSTPPTTTTTSKPPPEEPNAGLKVNIKPPYNGARDAVVSWQCVNCSGTLWVSADNPLGTYPVVQTGHNWDSLTFSIACKGYDIPVRAQMKVAAPGGPTRTYDASGVVGANCK